ncbi:MAG: hypothetical protein GXP47_14860 [Acidobacteria bacterium]|nr:hypothetical protein [Acidobacteriota bacterium]
MTRTAEVNAMMNNYLRRLRWGLSPLSEADRQEIVREVGSHLIDRLGASPSAENLHEELAKLGAPEEYARQFVESFDLSSAIASGAPWPMMRQAFRMAGSGALTALHSAGLLVLLAVSASLMALAPLKLVFPQNVGVWLGPGRYSFAAGFLAHPPLGGSEVLGYWIIPAGALLGIGLLKISIVLLRRLLLTVQEAADHRAGGLS